MRNLSRRSIEGTSPTWPGLPTCTHVPIMSLASCEGEGGAAPVFSWGLFVLQPMRSASESKAKRAVRQVWRERVDRFIGRFWFGSCHLIMTDSPLIAKTHPLASVTKRLIQLLAPTSKPMKVRPGNGSLSANLFESGHDQHLQSLSDALKLIGNVTRTNDFPSRSICQSKPQPMRIARSN